MEKVPLYKGEQHSPNLESKEYAFVCNQCLEEQACAQHKLIDFGKKVCECSQ